MGEGSERRLILMKKGWVYSTDAGVEYGQVSSRGLARTELWCLVGSGWVWRFHHDDVHATMDFTASSVRCWLITYGHITETKWHALQDSELRHVR